MKKNENHGPRIGALRARERRRFNQQSSFNHRVGRCNLRGGEVMSCIKHNGYKKRGYGIIRVNGKKVRAHRFWYEQWIAPIPDGMVIHHTCGCKDCLNVGHMKVMTANEHNEIHSSLDTSFVKFARGLHKEYGYTVKQLANVSDTPYNTMWDLITRRTWKHI